MIARLRTGLAAMIAAIAAMSVLAGAANAGTIHYDVAESPNYTIQDNGNGIVKVFFSGCLQSAGRYTINFRTTVQVTNKEATATWRVLKEDGQEPGSSFTPPSAFLPKGKPTTFDVSWSFNAPAPTNGVTMFRAKLNPDSGEELGEGAGIMVRAECIVEASAAPNPEGPVVIAPESTSISPPEPGSAASLPGLVEGMFPGVRSEQAQPAAPCISSPRRMALSAGASHLVQVTVRSAGRRIAGAKVRVTGPGINTTKKTNKKGVVRFRIKPRRSGTLVIQSDACFGADRLDVLGKRARMQRRVSPRFTG